MLHGVQECGLFCGVPMKAFKYRINMRFFKKVIVWSVVHRLEREDNAKEPYSSSSVSRSVMSDSL